MKPPTLALPFLLVSIDIYFTPHLPKFLAHLRHAFLALRDLGRFGAQILADFHRAELRAAHGAEMRDLVRLFRQRLVVELRRGFGVEAEIELILPAEIEPRA